LCFVHERIVSMTTSCSGTAAVSNAAPTKTLQLAGAQVQLGESLRGSIEIYYETASFIMATKKG